MESVGKVIIRAIGYLKPPLRDFCETLHRRIIFPLHIDEIRGVKDSSKDFDSQLLLKGLPREAEVVALAEDGELLTSKEFAKWLCAATLRGKPLYFLIGGAEGLSAEALDRAGKKISFGRMTWPHQLVRVMLVEQLYRSQQILKNHPYHRE